MDTAIPYLILGLTTVITVILAVFVLRRWPAWGALPLAVVLAAVSFWAFFYILELAIYDFQAKQAMVTLQYLGIITIPTAWLTFTLSYTRQDHWLTRRTIGLLLIVPILSTLALWTNPLHGQFRMDQHIEGTVVFSTLAAKYGPLAWLHVAYSYALLLIGTLLLGRFLLRSRQLYRGQAIVLLLMTIMPWVGNLVYLMGYVSFDLTPVGFAVAGLALSWGLFRFRLLDIVPVARDAVFEDMADAVIVLDTRLRVVDLNPAARRLLALGREGGVGQPVGSLLPAVADNLGGGQTAGVELSAGGRFLSMQTSLLHKRGGQAGGWLVVLYDITDRKQAEAALQQQLRDTQILNEIMAALTTTYDTTVILDTICEELGRALNLPQTSVGLLDDRGLHLTLVAEYLEPGRPSARGVIVPLSANTASRQVIETGRSLIIPDMQTDPRLDDEMHVEARRRGTVTLLLIPLRVGERVFGALGLDSITPREFTTAEVMLAENAAAIAGQALERSRLYHNLHEELVERRRVQHELRQANEQLAEANRLKSHFLANMSHELRTPLNSILGYAEMIQQGAYGTINERQADRLEKVSRNGRMLLQLINDILDISKIDAGRMDLRPVPTNARLIIEESMAAMEALATHKGLDLLRDLEDIPPVIADPDRLRQVVTNLLGNAIKFTPSGTITLRTRLYDDQIADDSLPPGFDPGGKSWVLIAVEDTGIGIAPKDQGAIFDEFRQADSSPTRQFDGTGLGLAICRRLVELMKGNIWVESALGLGSTFSVLLPAAPEDSVVVESEQPEARLFPGGISHES